MPNHILCFHGAYQNNKTLQSKLDRYVRALHRQGFVVEFIEGQCPVDDDPTVEHPEDKRMYWPFPRPYIFGEVSEESVTRATDQAMSELSCTPEEVVGILGFSQGSKMAVAMAARLPNVRALVLIAGFSCTSPIHLRSQERCANIPTMHIYGTGDQVVPVALNEEWRKSFPCSEQFVHSGKHVIPDNGPIRSTIIDFFTRYCSPVSSAE